MQILYGFDNLPTIREAVATVGSYDGVHSGHRELIGQVISRAKARGGESVVLTFDPHPRITLGKADGLKLLTMPEEKALLLEQLGVDYIIVIPFDLSFSRLSHEEFIEQYLIRKVGIKELVVGYNHHFGHNKTGDYNYLTSNHPLLEVTRVEQQLVDSNKVSSTVVRATIEQGDMRSAKQLLGHPYIIIGNSDQSGFVTTDRYKLLPIEGVYDAVVNGNKMQVTLCNNGVKCNVYNEKVTIEL